MRLAIVYSKQATKFLAKNTASITAQEINSGMQLAMRKLLKREELAVDIGRLKGGWQGYWRLRIGGVRVIFRYDGSNPVIVDIEKIEYRGSVY